MLKKIDVKDLKLDPVEAYGDRWALLTAGNKESCNPMTVSWGGLGVLWSQPVVTAYVRPQRYTFGFMEKSDYFTMSFFAPGQYREALTLCGTKSGRDMDKFAAAGLTPAFAECGAPYPAQAQVVLVCEKLYAQNMTEESFLDKGVMEKNYPQKDYHRVYVGRIVEAYMQED